MQTTFISCLATVAAIQAGLKVWKWVVVDLGVLLAESFAAAGIVYQASLAPEPG